MFEHPATQANLETLRERGAVIVGPVEGHLASGSSGIGRMVEPAELLGQIRLALAQDGPLKGRKVVVTAGGTQEPIDSVRVITNRSSGKQGFALAQASLDLGAQVTLIAAPTQLETPIGAQGINVRTVGEMLDAVKVAIADADALVMAAAVADFRAACPAGDKLKKRDGVPEITLEAAPDILGTVAHLGDGENNLRVTVGFAAECEDLIENAQAKLSSKNLDLIVANDISATDAGFEVDTNQVTLLFSDGRVEALPIMSKMDVAKAVIAEVVSLLGS